MATPDSYTMAIASTGGPLYRPPLINLNCRKAEIATLSLYFGSHCCYTVLYDLIQCSVLPRKCIKSLVSKFLYSDYVYRYFYSYQSCFLFFLICYGWSPLSTPTTPTLWDIQFTPLRAGFYGIGSRLATCSFKPHRAYAWKAHRVVATSE